MSAMQSSCCMTFFATRVGEGWFGWEVEDDGWSQEVLAFSLSAPVEVMVAKETIRLSKSALHSRLLATMRSFKSTNEGFMLLNKGSRKRGTWITRARRPNDGLPGAQALSLVLQSFCLAGVSSTTECKEANSARNFSTTSWRL